jgi:hypothetical protein
MGRSAYVCFSPVSDRTADIAGGPARARLGHHCKAALCLIIASMRRHGLDLFRHACKFGLEGMVSKRRDSTYRSGRSPNRIKVKNRNHPAMKRANDVFRRNTLNQGRLK